MRDPKEIEIVITYTPPLSIDHVAPRANPTCLLKTSVVALVIGFFRTRNSLLGGGPSTLDPCQHEFSRKKAVGSRMSLSSFGDDQSTIYG